MALRPSWGEAALNYCHSGTIHPVWSRDLVDRAGEIEVSSIRLADSFAVFDRQDSGCISFGIELNGLPWFVKKPVDDGGRRSLLNAVQVHRAVSHRSLVPLVRVVDSPDPTLIYPWTPGVVLNHATREGTDRTGLERFRALPLDVKVETVSTVLEVHVEVAEAGFVAVDFYDGCLLYDFDRERVFVIDIDEYRRGPFVVDADRLPGSLRYMAPEELVRGAVIDERSNVFTLGRMISQLIGSVDCPEPVVNLVARATSEERQERFETVRRLAARWATATGSGTGWCDARVPRSSRARDREGPGHRRPAP